MSAPDWTPPFVAGGAALSTWAQRGSEGSPVRAALGATARFFLLQAWACAFGGLILGLILLTGWLWPRDFPLARYDFLFLAAVSFQAVLLATRLERWDEAAVIAIFHVVGTIMELFKTSQGSWSYPEAAFFRIAGVPLFTGFMYSAIGSYMARSIRLFDVAYLRYPPLWTTWILAVAAYVNFYSHHFVPDIRLGLFAFSVLIFWPTLLQFTVDRTPRRVPVLIVFALVAFFIWVAENIGSVAGAWLYPDQHRGWRMVSLEKLGSWYLLMLLSVVLLTVVHRPRRIGDSAALQTQAPARVRRRF